MINEHLLQLLIALVVGSIIGLEREINGKAAGFRTMALICVGSTILTIVSIHIGVEANRDRIAANILTGIGFIGAGVVFKDGLNVTGITTAATIWVTAALGMCIGSEEYSLAIEGMILTLVVLFLFENLLSIITRKKEHRSYSIYFKKESIAPQIVTKSNELDLKCVKKNETKNDGKIHLAINLYGTKENIEKFNSFLIDLDNVKSFDSFL